MKTFSMLSIPIAFVGAVILLGIATTRIAVYHDGICAAQKWERRIFFIDASEEDYDEFGIEERWSKAHRKPCDRVWIAGTLESDDGAYWPALHLAIAEGRPVHELAHLIDTASSGQLLRKDRAGRTVLHWAVIYPDSNGRKELIEKLIHKGLSLDERDKDGLSPREWQKQSEDK